MLRALLWLIALSIAKGATCPVTVSYAVALGQGGQQGNAGGAARDSNGAADSDLPIFFGRLGMYSSNVGAPFCLACMPRSRKNSLLCFNHRLLELKVERKGETLAVLPVSFMRLPSEWCQQMRPASSAFLMIMITLNMSARSDAIIHGIQQQ